MKMTDSNKSLSENDFHAMSIPIDSAILMCDNERELLKLACVMLQRAVEIFETHLGVDGRNFVQSNQVSQRPPVRDTHIYISFSFSIYISINKWTLDLSFLLYFSLSLFLGS
jgi:hypothetical protein